MSIVYSIKAAIVNESKTNIERLAAKITQVSNKTDEDFIKTFPLITNSRNLASITNLKDDLEVYKNKNFLGISFLSYGYINFIHFTSTFRSFQLDKDDQLTFYFKDAEPMEFVFNTPRTTEGFINKNIYPIDDVSLTILSENNLEYWKLKSQAKNLQLVGGFCFNDYNKQYKSQKVGQKMLRLMAENILIIKDKLSPKMY